jgi:aspartyl-tRNA(Asn)/glutamyl-tRNA(Gln) amidotransferase subunit A
MVPAATGSDTGGSLRSPASACGVSSIKPTYGRVSTYGVIPCVWTLDHAGPMARSAADVALLLDYIAEPDPRDPASLTPPPRPATSLCAPTPGPQPLAGLRLGVPDGAAASLPAGTARLWESFLDEVRNLGATLVGFAVPANGPSIVGALGEAWVYHQQFGAAALARYTPEVAALVLAARAAAESATGDYIDYQRQRLRYANAWRETLAGLRLAAVLKPGSSVDGATRDRATGMTIITGSVTGDYGWADAAGLPVAMTPVGRSAGTGMPFGVQIGGAPHDEATLLRIAIDYQAAHPHWAEAPPAPPSGAGQTSAAVGSLMPGQIHGLR